MTSSHPFNRHQPEFNKSELDIVQKIAPDCWAELRSLLALSKALSLTKAAEMLNSSPATVSRNIKRLEDITQTRLILPTSRGVQLTDKGLVLARRAAEINSIVASSTDALLLGKGEIDGSVRVSITDGLGAFWLTPRLADVLDEHRSVDIRVSSLANFVDLKQNRTDVIVSYVPSDDPEIVSREVGAMHFIPVASRGYIQRYGVPEQSNISEHRFAQLSFYDETVPLWNDWNQLRRQGKTPFLSDNSVVHGFAVKNGIGIGLLGSYTVIDPEIVSLSFGIHITHPIYVNALKASLEQDQVQLVFSLLSGLFGEKNPWFGPEFTLPNHTAWDIGFRYSLGITEA